jgi:hypothetical protein
MPRLEFSNVMTAPGTEAPRLSVTVPRREVVLFCPQDEAAINIKTIEASVNFRLIADHPMAAPFESSQR